MLTLTPLRVAAVATFTSLSTFAAPAIAQGPTSQRPAIEHRLPASTYAALQFAGLGASRTVADTPLGKLVSDLLQQLGAEVRERRIDPGLAFAERQLRRGLQSFGLDANDVRAVLQQPMALAVGRWTIEGNGASVALVVETGAAGDALRRCADALAKACVDRGVAQREAAVMVGGFQLEHLTTPFGMTLFYGAMGDCFVISQSRHYLAELAAVLGGAPGLGADQRLHALRQQLGGAPLASAFVNVQPFAAAFAPLMPYELESWSDLLGLGAPHGMFAGVTAGEHASDLLHVGIGGAADGLMKALVSAPLEPTYQQVCSPDTVLLAAASIDPVRLDAAVHRMVAALPAGYTRQLQQHWERSLAHAPFEVEQLREIVGAFGNQVALSLALTPGAVVKPELLLRVSLRDEAKVRELLPQLEAMTAEAGIEWKQRDGDPCTVRFCSLPIDRQAGAGMVPLPRAYAVHAGALWIASDAQALLRGVRNAAAPREPAPDLGELAQRTATANGFVHLRSFRAAEIGWRTVETFVSPMIDEHADELGFDSSVVPDVDTAARAFDSSTFVYRVGADGFALQSHGPFTFGNLLATAAMVLDELLQRAGSKTF